MDGLGVFAACMLAMAGRPPARGEQQRFKPLGEDEMTDAQRKVYPIPGGAPAPLASLE